MALTNGWNIGADQGGAWNIGAASQGPVTLTPDPAVLTLAEPEAAVSIDINLAFTAPPTWTATPLGAFVSVNTSVVPKHPTPAPAALVAPDVTLTIQLVPDPAVADLTPDLDPLLLGPVPSIEVDPDPAPLQLGNPNAITGAPVTLTPDPAAATLAAPAEILNRILSVGAAPVQLVSVRPLLDRALLVDPAAVVLAGPDPVLDRIVEASEAAGALVAPDVTLAGPLALVTLEADPAVLSPTAPDVGADRILTPAPAAVQLAQAVVEVPRIFLQRPVAETELLAPAVSVNIAPAGQSVSPDPAVLPLVAAALVVDRTLLVGPASTTLATLETEVPRDLGPEPAAVSLQLPTIAVQRILTPDPAALVAGGAETTVTAPASGTLTPDPAVVEVPRIFEPRPVAEAELLAPAVSLTVTFEPAASALQLLAPDPLLVFDLALAPGPASLVLTPPATSIEGGIDITPDPAVVELAAPAITTLGDTLRPDPAVLVSALPIPLLVIPGRPMIEAELSLVETLSNSLGLAEGVEILAPLVATLEESLGLSNVLEAELALVETMNHPKHL